MLQRQDVSLREWLRRPGHLLVAFLIVTLLPACVLGVLGWQLYQQDVALESRYLQDRLEHAADRAVAALDAQLGRLQEAVAAPGGLPPGDDVVRVAFGPGAVDAEPRERLLYYPPGAVSPSAPTQPFLRGEALEFGRRDADAAEAVFRQLAASRDVTIRAGALLRLARTLRSAGRPDEALAAYEQMALLGAAPVGAGPAALVARRAHSELLLALGRKNQAEVETTALLADLRGGRWKLDRSTFEFHAQGLSDRLEHPGAVSADALALSTAVTRLWERYRGLGTGDGLSQGRESVWIEDRPVLLVWRGTAAAMNGLAAGRGCLGLLWRTLTTPVGIALTLADSEGHVVMGAPPPRLGPLAVRPAADTGLPWTIKVAAVDPASESGRASTRRLLLLAGLAAVSLLVAGGGTLVWGATARELAVARLQSDFVSAVSHEFRTPLTSLRHLTELLEDGVVTNEVARREYLHAPVAGNAPITPAGGSAAQLRTDGDRALPLPPRTRGPGPACAGCRRGVHAREPGRRVRYRDGRRGGARLPHRSGEPGARDLEPARERGEVLGPVPYRSGSPSSDGAALRRSASAMAAWASRRASRRRSSRSSCGAIRPGRAARKAPASASRWSSASSQATGAPLTSRASPAGEAPLRSCCRRSGIRDRG